MKTTIKTIGTICFGVLLFVSGVFAQETFKTPLNNAVDSATDNPTKLQTRVSIIDYVKALETINAYNSIHQKQRGISGVTILSLHLAPQQSYQELIASKLQSWDSLRTDQFILKQKNADYAVTTPQFGHKLQHNWASYRFDKKWRSQEFVDEFNPGRYVANEDWRQSSFRPISLSSVGN